MKTVYRVKLAGREMIKRESRSIELKSRSEVDVAVNVAELLDCWYEVEEIRYKGEDRDDEYLMQQAAQDACDVVESAEYSPRPKKRNRQ